MSYRVRVASLYLLGFFIDLVNMFIANVAYPEIGRQFNAPIEQLAWISNGYILGLTLIITISRWLTQKLGTKRVLLLSLAVFILATCGVANASSINQLIVYRVFQGLGGGSLIPIGQTLTYSLYPNHQRAKLSAMIMLVALMAPALSPTFGGVLVDMVNWRWVFLASLPLAVVTLVLTVIWLKSDSLLPSYRPLDVGGLIISNLALILILLGLTFLGALHTQLGLEVLILGLVLLFCYVRRALVTANPLLNLRLIKTPLLRTAMLIYQLIPGVFTGISLVATLYLQEQLGMDATQVGTLMLPWALASFMAITVMGKIFNIVGPRPLIITGCVIQGLGIGLLTFITDIDAKTLTMISYALMGFGGSLCSSSAQSLAFIGLNDDALADASALWNINRQLSFCLGTTLISLLLNLCLNSVGINRIHAYQLCFAITALSSILPLLICLRIANRNIVNTLNKEKS